LQFLSWPDFLLGLNASENGTGTFSNVYASLDVFGLLNREYRVWEAAAFAQDDYKVTRSLTLNLGLRYERLGQFADQLGRNSSFDVSKADPTPPPGGSLAGYIVASNFPGTVPAGVLRANNTFGNYNANPNTIAPRFGFAWQILPNTSRLALRGGCGMYYSRPTGQAFSQSVSAPFALPRLSIGPANAPATFAEPFEQPFQTPDSFPVFPPYGFGMPSTINTTAPNFRPALIQQFGLNLQAEVYPGWLLEIGYLGTQGTHLQRLRSLNQALQATPENPIRGVTSDTPWRTSRYEFRCPASPQTRFGKLKPREAPGTTGWKSA
jgi:TonB dependent receptor-like, beta-barrel